MIQFLRISILSCLISVLYLGCSSESTNDSIVGLWAVSSVKMGSSSNTPIARWIRFEADSTQVSGNGWLQHSYGKWTVKKQTISIQDFNGTKDNDGSFTFSVQGNKMTWRRSERGQEIVVELKRIQKIPQSDGNKLIGLWKLTKAEKDSSEITSTLAPKKNASLFIRWDNVFVEHNMPKGKRYGIYKIHGHKPEIQMVNYGNSPQFSFWSFKISNNKLTLTSTDSKTVMEFQRIHEFLK